MEYTVHECTPYFRRELAGIAPWTELVVITFQRGSGNGERKTDKSERAKEECLKRVRVFLMISVPEVC